MSIHVLVIEDNEDDFKIAERLLTEWRNDVEITWHTRIYDAIKALRSHPRGYFDRIYLDPCLPDVAGEVDKAFEVLVDSGCLRAEDVVIVTGGKWGADIIAKIANRGARYLTKEDAFFGQDNRLAQLMLGMQDNRERTRIQAEVNEQIVRFQNSMGEQAAMFRQMMLQELKGILIDVTALKSQVGENSKTIERIMQKTDGPQILAIRETMAEMKAQNQRDREEISYILNRIGDEKSGMVKQMLQAAGLSQEAVATARKFGDRLKAVEDGLQSKQTAETIELERIKSSGQIRLGMITSFVALVAAVVPLLMVVVPKWLDSIFPSKPHPIESVPSPSSPPSPSAPVAETMHE